MMNHHDDIRSDATLVALVLAGERETFAPLLLRYYTSVARLCRRLLGPTPEAQDIAQEAALQAFLRLGELQEPRASAHGCTRSPLTWRGWSCGGGACSRSTQCRMARR